MLSWLSKGLRHSASLIDVWRNKYANGSTRTETPGKRHWFSGNGSQDSDRRTSGQHEIGSGAIRQGGREGAGGRVDAGTPVGNCETGSEREVGVMAAPTSAAAVANEFLDLCWASSGVPPCDQMKIQKLVYYAQAWYLAEKSISLFEEDIEAWPHGPVIRNLYLEFKDCGRNPIKKKATEFKIDMNDELRILTITPQIIDVGVKAFIKRVWDVHKQFTGIQLSNSTHSDGEPWAILKKQYGDLGGKPSIPNELIEKVFKEKMRVNAAA
jgi:uncharacterized phage-associated protein